VSPRLVSLLSDFGLADTYVGQMKGAVLAVAPDAQLVDVTHAVPPQDVRTGAFLLWSAVEVFPAGTVHLAVVDPGVGSTRRAVAAQAARGDVFVGPDNGLLTPAIGRLGGPAGAVELCARTYWRTDQPSTTFHGRDVFGPVAGHLAKSVPLERLGPPVELSRPFSLALADGLVGEVVYVDGFGNLVTNLPAERLPAQFHVRLGERLIPSAPHYQAVGPGELMAVIGSFGLLEISARDGSAAAVAGAARGSPVSLLPRQEQWTARRPRSGWSGARRGSGRPRH
jgi:S-adenosylmethionine hydrolase